MNFSPTAVRPWAGEAHCLNRSCSFPVFRSHLPIPPSIDDEAITVISIGIKKFSLFLWRKRGKVFWVL